MTRMKSNILLLVASVAIGLLLAEVFLRMFVPQETKRLAIFDPELGWRGEPGGRGTYIRMKDNIETEFTYNELGFRDQNLPPIDPARRQILMVGDSFVESLEVPFESSFHELVEQSLRANVDSAYAVINFSSQGYSTAQEFLAYRKFRDRISPRVVLSVFYTGNDFSDNSNSPYAHLDERDSLVFPVLERTWSERTWLSLERWAYERSHLVFFLKNTAENILNTRITQQPRERSNRPEEIHLEITKRLLLQMSQEFAADRLGFGIVVIPSRADLVKNRPEPSDFVAGVCAEAGIPCLRLDGFLRPEHYFENDEHLNEEGHRVAARAVMTFLSGYFDITRTVLNDRPS